MNISSLHCIASCLVTSLVYYASLALTSCACNNTLNIKIRTDSHPGEIAWYLFEGFYNDTKYSINSSNTNLYTQQCSFVDERVCISNGCFFLLINDTFGDGICCNAGYGYYEISLNNKMLTFADLQYYSGKNTILYFCTDLFNINSSVNTKELLFTTEKRSKIVVYDNNNTILYYSENFAPYGEPYVMQLPIDAISQILIYTGQSDRYGYWYSSQSKWTLVKTFTPNSENWDLQQINHVRGLSCAYVVRVILR